MLELDFDQVDDPYKASPAWWNIINTKENEKIEQDDIAFELELQYKDLENLGINYWSQYENIDQLTITTFLTYIHDHYLPLSDLEIILARNDASNIIGKAIYELLFVDMVNDTIPTICSVNKIKPCTDLILNKNIKGLLLTHYQNILTQLNNLYPINKDLSPPMIKHSIAIDIFNADVETFIEKFLTPVITKYSHIISLKVV
jgi:hypothetical protein